MNETHKTPEPLAAILAEMRSANTQPAFYQRAIDAYADRIEAAAKRERAEWHAETEAAKDARNRVACRMRSEFAAKCRNCTERAPGNAAAMREALDKAECVLLVAARFATDDAFDDADARENLRDVDWDGALAEIRAALAAPARNCDRFATAEEAVAAFADHLRAWENAHGICSEYPDHAVQVPAGAFAWLFAPAEGGAE